MKSFPTQDLVAGGIGENNGWNNLYTVPERYLKRGVVEDRRSNPILIAKFLIVFLTDRPYVDRVSVSSVNRFDHGHREMASFTILAYETQQGRFVARK